MHTYVVLSLARRYFITILSIRKNIFFFLSCASADANESTENDVSLTEPLSVNAQSNLKPNSTSNCILMPLNPAKNESEEAINTYFTEFQIECLNAHNIYRRRHGVLSLVLSKELCEYALEWANVSHKL